MLLLLLPHPWTPAGIMGNVTYFSEAYKLMLVLVGPCFQLHLPIVLIGQCFKLMLVLIGQCFKLMLVLIGPCFQLHLPLRLAMQVGTLQAGAWVVWLSSVRGSGVTWYRVSVSWPANMAG
jgi:hypothetical protein